MPFRHSLAAFLAEAAAAVPGLAYVALTVALLATSHLASTPLWPIHDLTLSEAAALRDGAAVVRLVQFGKDPNTAWRVRAGILGPADRDLLPMEAAIGAKRLEIVELLLASGATIEPELRHRLTCLARIRDAGDITEYLQRKAPAGWSPSACDGVRAPWE